MTHETTEQPIAPAVQAVLDLFENELAELKFPDIDQSVLKEAARCVDERAEVLLRAEAALQAARESLYDSQELLLQKCHRAVAYARIYAEEDAALLERLDAIGLPKSGRNGKGAAAPSSSSDAKVPARRATRGHRQRPLFLESPPSEEPTSIEHQAA